jgi:hypothetical protein
MPMSRTLIERIRSAVAEKKIAGETKAWKRRATSFIGVFQLNIC